MMIGIDAVIGLARSRRVSSRASSPSWATTTAKPWSLRLTSTNRAMSGSSSTTRMRSLPVGSTGAGSTSTWTSPPARGRSFTGGHHLDLAAQRPYRLRRVGRPVDGGTGDERVRAGLGGRLDGVGVDPAVDLDPQLQAARVPAARRSLASATGSVAASAWKLTLYEPASA